MFTVVIPTRDHAGTLTRTLDAVLTQTARAGEVIVVDDGSNDGTAQHLASRHDDSLRVLRTDGIGVSGARNAGLAEASGELVAFLDDDDVPSSRWLERLGALVADGVGLVTCGATIHRPGRRPVQARPRQEHGEVRPLLLAGTFAARRRLLEDAGGYRAGLRYAENTELGMRLLPLCAERGLEVMATGELLVDIYQSPNRSSKLDRHESLLEVLDAHADTFRSDPERLRRWLTVAAVDAWRSGEESTARFLLWRAARARPWPPSPWARLAAAWLPPLGRRVWGVGSSPGPQARAVRS